MLFNGRAVFLFGILVLSFEPQVWSQARHHRAPLAPCEILLNPMEAGRRLFDRPLRGWQALKTTGRATTPYTTYPMDRRYTGEEIDVSKTEAFRNAQAREAEHVEYLYSEQQRKAYQVLPTKRGWLDSKGFRICPRETCRGVLIMAPTGELYFSTQHRQMQFHHSSFLAGAPVAFAGMAVFENGVLTQVDNESGHYKMSWTGFLNLVQELQKVSIPEFEISTGPDQAIGPFDSRHILSSQFARRFHLGRS